MWRSKVNETYIRKSIHSWEIDDNTKYDRKEVYSYFVVKHVLLCEHQWERACEIDIVCPCEVPEHDH